MQLELTVNQVTETFQTPVCDLKSEAVVLYSSAGYKYLTDFVVLLIIYS